MQPAYPAKCAIKWTGIDNSSFAVEVAKILQGETDDINFFKDHRDYSINQEVKRSIFTSRFVSSYAFTSTAEFIAFLTKHNFDAMVLDEPFNAGRSDLKTYNHGLPICYFQLDELNHFAISNGYQIEVIDWYPDNPARSGRCLNMKLAIQRKGTPSVAHVSRDLSLDHNYKLLVSNFTTEDLLHQITADRWRQVDQFKFQNPVWSQTPAEITSSSLYMWAREFAATTYHKWRAGIIRTTLRGQNVQNEIRRYLSEEHSNSNHQKRE